MLPVSVARPPAPPGPLCLEVACRSATTLASGVADISTPLCGSRRASCTVGGEPRRWGSGGAKPPGLMIEYGAESSLTIAWDDAASERMKKIPAFVRGMVVKAVEDSCRRNGIGRVTAEELEKIRARMPTPKIFG